MSLALSFITIFLGGAAVLDWAFAGHLHSRCHFLLKCFLAFGFGLALWSCSYIVILFIVGPHLTWIWAKDMALSFLAATYFWFRPRYHHSKAHLDAVRQQAPRWLRVVFFVSACVAIMVFVGSTMRIPEGEWDAWMTWNTRARFLFRDGTDFATIFATEIAHADYPLLLPGLIAQTWMMLGSESIFVPPMIALTFSAITVGALVVAIVIFRGTASGLMAGLVLLGTPMFTMSAAIQYADVVLGSYLLVTCIMITLAASGMPYRVDRLLILSGAAASMMAWTKNEGIFYGLSLLVALAICKFGPSQKRLSRLNRITSFLLGALPVIALLAYFKLKHAPSNDYLQRITFSDIAGRIMDLDRRTTLFLAIGHKFFEFGAWNFFLICLPLLWLKFGRQSDRLTVTGPVIMALVFILLGLGAVVLITPYQMDFQIATSMDRLLIQCWPSIIFAVFLSMPPLHPQRRNSSSSKMFGNSG